MSDGNICVLKTDPSFSLTLDAVTELNRYSKLDPLGFKVMRRRNIKIPFNSFKSNFISILQSLLLRATSLEKLYDPDFRMKARIMSKACGLEEESSGNTQITSIKEEAVKISLCFNQLFTDSVVFDQLESLKQLRFQPWVTTMYVLNPREELFTEIQATIMLAAIPNGQPMSTIHCNITVCCIKCKINSKDICKEDCRFRHYPELRKMISRYNNIVEGAEELDLHKRLNVMCLASRAAPVTQNSSDSSEEESDDEGFDV